MLACDRHFYATARMLAGYGECPHATPDQSQSNLSYRRNLRLNRKVYADFSRMAGGSQPGTLSCSDVCRIEHLTSTQAKRSAEEETHELKSCAARACIVRGRTSSLDDAARRIRFDSNVRNRAPRGTHRYAGVHTHTHDREALRPQTRVRARPHV
jgi:hypothetical protein